MKSSSEMELLDIIIGTTSQYTRKSVWNRIGLLFYAAFPETIINILKTGNVMSSTENINLR